MAVELNHTIIYSRNNSESAIFLSEILGLPPPQEVAGKFMVVKLSNRVSLDFDTAPEPIVPQHYAFLVSDKEFDEIFDRIKKRKIRFWADPQAAQENEISHALGGRGFYFIDPSGHYLEVRTVLP